MYNREIAAKRRSPVEQGKPLAGTWKGAFEEADLLEVERPFPWALPRWMRNLRIKEWQSFFIQDERFSLQMLVSDLKYYRWAQVFFCDKKQGDQVWFRKLTPFGGWRMPRSLANSTVESRSWGFFFRIHNWLDADTIRVDLNIEARGKRPALTAHLEYDLGEEGLEPMAVSLLFSESRNMYAYKTFAPLRGDLVFGERHISFDPAEASGIFGDFKGYYPYRTRPIWCTASGRDGDKRRFGFSIAANQTRESFKNNENALWVDTRLSPLPPVRITMSPEGGGDWIIQDMEGMVDLVFSPRLPVQSRMNLFVTRAEYESPLGFFNGALVDAGGNRIQVHNLWGMGEKIFLRV
jgi:hypothetical protein